jgi:hypothetical protein
LFAAFQLLFSTFLGMIDALPQKFSDDLDIMTRQLDDLIFLCLINLI